MRENHDVILLNIGYRLAPPTITERQRREDMVSLWEWLSKHIPTALETMGAKVDVKWDSTAIFGGSYGGSMAILAWLISDPLDRKPLGLCIRVVVLADALTDEYQRDPGVCVKTHITRDRAERDSRCARETIEKMPWTIPRSGTEPPHWMLAAPIFSIASEFPYLVQGRSLQKMVKDTLQCPDRRTRFYITHGDRDAHVKHQTSIAFVKLLKKKWGLNVHFELRPGGTHASDVNEPLTDDLKAFLDACLADQSVKMSEPREWCN
jgi:hypothetical protein